MKMKVLVGMSGGVDSSMSAYLLQLQGYEVIGVYLKLHNFKAGYHERNIQQVQRIAKFLGVEYHILDLSLVFKEEVYEYFISEYKSGNTPNPCVVCNKEIKFGAMYDFAQSMNIDYVATGHYVKTDGISFYEADDLSKDQSYFLAQVKQNILPSLLFPMGTYKKEDIVKNASAIPAFHEIIKQKESQEICFVDNEYVDILRAHYKVDNSGKVLDINGKEIGSHKGYMHYTIGKRRGFYVHGAQEPYYVKALDSQNNTITVSKKEELAINYIMIDRLNLYIEKESFECTVKLRYRTLKVPCHVFIKGGYGYVELEEDVYGIALGQTAVFYHKSMVLGSGFIRETQKR